MIALPFHPSNVCKISEFNENLSEFDIKDKIINGRLKVDQAVIAGCAGGTYENVAEAANILKEFDADITGLSLSVYPASQPVFLSLTENGYISGLMKSGAVIRTAFCGPCFGAGDVPQNNGLSIRHCTRNFPNREGSIPKDGQKAAVALMDSRSIAATVANGGYLTGADTVDYDDAISAYAYSSALYEKKVYDGWGKAKLDTELVYGPNIADWPSMPSMQDNLLIRVDSFLTDPVTTTDELIPSGETSSYRSNPKRLAEFTLSRRDPEYVSRTRKDFDIDVPQNTNVGSCIYAVKPGDGSAREQAASCQRVLGGSANIAKSYATKRYRSNCINWGIVPFTLPNGVEPKFGLGDYIFIPDIKKAVENKTERITAYILNGDDKTEFILELKDLTDEERKILIAGCLINYYRK
jgi:aconitate hydratase